MTPARFRFQPPSDRSPVRGWLMSEYAGTHSLSNPWVGITRPALVKVEEAHPGYWIGTLVSRGDEIGAWGEGAPVQPLDPSAVGSLLILLPPNRAVVAARPVEVVSVEPVTVEPQQIELVAVASKPRKPRARKPA